MTATDLHPPLTPTRRHTLLHGAVELLIIFLAGLFIYGWKLGVAPIAGTEPLRALVAHQMVTGGTWSDWLLPHLYGELYLRKPPLQYWTVAATEKLLGHGDELIWRLPSAVGSALLAMLLAAWSARWFGPRARLVTGFGCLALIALSAQDRGGDIDALDTAAAVLAACCILEIAFGPSSEPAAGAGQRRWVWIAPLALSVGALLLFKGPAGLPTVIGALLALVLRRRALLRPGLWIGLLLGAAVFAAWLGAIYLLIQHQHLVVDTSGADEAEQRMLLLHPSPAVLGKALLVPVLVLVYALPISLGMPIAHSAADRLTPADPRRDRIRALSATVIASLLIGVIAGIVNPRYSYVPMPLLAMLLGAAVAIAWERPGIDFAGTRQLLTSGLRIVCVLWAGVAVVLACAAFRLGAQVDPREHLAPATIPLLASASIAVVVGCWAAFAARPRVGSRGWAAAGLIVLAGVPFAEMKNAQRTRFSGRAVGAELRADLGDDPRVSACSVVRDLPQVFYYAGVPVDAFGEHGIPQLAAAPGPRWIVLENDQSHHEYNRMAKLARNRFQRVIPLHLASDTLYLIRLAAPAAATRPGK